MDSLVWSAVITNRVFENHGILDNSSKNSRRAKVSIPYNFDNWSRTFFKLSFIFFRNFKRMMR